MNLLTLLQVSSEFAGEAVATATEQAGAQPQGSPWTMWLMLGGIFVVMYFFMIRPQRKQQKEQEKFRNALAKGTKVVTISGVYGTIDEVNENTVLLEIDKGVKIKVAKNAIQSQFNEQA